MQPRKNTKNATLINDPYESTFIIFTDEVKRDENIKLEHSSSIDIFRNSSDIVSGFKKIRKNGMLLHYLLVQLTMCILEH